MRAQAVVNATGVWADRIRPGELHDEAEVPVIRPSRGTHITFRHEDLPLVAGAIVPAGGGRSIFALPWLGRTLIGTTDNDYDGESLEHIPPSEDDIDAWRDPTPQRGSWYAGAPGGFGLPSGHGASSLDKALETTADIYSFIMFNMGVAPGTSSGTRD